MFDLLVLVSFSHLNFPKGKTFEQTIIHLFRSKESISTEVALNCANDEKSRQVDALAKWIERNYMEISHSADATLEMTPS